MATAEKREFNTMKFQDLISETTIALLSNKVRSGLTVLGIVIGIASVIAMLAIGAGASNSIQSNIQSLGSNLILVTPGAPRGVGQQVSAGRGNAQTLTNSDVTALTAGISSEATALAPDLTTRQQVIAQGTNTNTSVIGTVASYADIRNITVSDGSFITDEQNTNLSKVAVLGPTTRDDLFGVGSDAIGKTIRIKGIQFSVIGITTTKGGTGFNNQDDRIFIPLSVAQRYLVGSGSDGFYVTTVSIQAQSSAVMTDLQNQVTSILLDQHHIADPTQADFSTLNQSDIVSAASSVTNTLTLFLVFVASISLIVGGIGIMNMMLTTVTERTREIGLRKAIGAKRNDISTQFLAEAILLTFSGGMLGIALGWLVALILSWTGIIQASVSLFSVLLAFGISAGIGIVFGYYPARRASSLSPIEALRYE